MSGALDGGAGGECKLVSAESAVSPNRSSCPKNGCPQMENRVTTVIANTIPAETTQVKILLARQLAAEDLLLELVCL